MIVTRSSLDRIALNGNSSRSLPQQQANRRGDYLDFVHGLDHIPNLLRR
jgi:hypothetical protein